MWVFLDDKRKSPLIVHNNSRGLGEIVGKSDRWVYARNYDEFIEIVKSNFDQIDLISFDHDIDSWEDILDDNGIINPVERTGKTAAQYVIDFCMDNGKVLPNWFVHSDNSKGNENIRSLLTNYMHKSENRIIGKMMIPFGYVDGQFFYHL